MGQLTYTTAEIQALLDSIGTISELTGFTSTDLVSAILELQTKENNSITSVSNKVGTLSSLSTTAKTDLVAAINEVFQSASDFKTTIAGAITGAGVSTSASASSAQMATNIGQIPSVARQGYIYPYVQNGESITPTGTYATTSYIDLDFGVKVGYKANGDVLILMKAKTSTAYEYLDFALASGSMSGVTLTAQDMSASSNATGKPNCIYGCVLSGISQNCNIAVACGSVDSTYDWVKCTITVTAV